MKDKALRYKKWDQVIVKLWGVGTEASNKGRELKIKNATTI